MEVLPAIFSYCKAMGSTIWLVGDVLEPFEVDISRPSPFMYHIFQSMTRIVCQCSRSLVDIIFVPVIQSMVAAVGGGTISSPLLFLLSSSGDESLLYHSLF